MNDKGIVRKDLDSQEFLKLRQATEKIANIVDKRVKSHLNVLRPLFVPRKLFGAYVKSANMQEVPGAEKAFAELQELYGGVCSKPYDLPKKLQPPIPPIANQLEATPLQYTLASSAPGARGTSITCPTRWILSYQSECPLVRLRAMISGKESRQADDMRQALIDHLAVVVFFQHYPVLTSLFQDLRYEVLTERLDDLGGLPVVVLQAPVPTFLPPDAFIQQITQLSGIPAFQEIVDLEGLEQIPDPLKESLKIALS